MDRNSRRAGLAVANDQLALAAPDGNHAINRFDTGLHRRIYRLARNYTRGYTLHGTILVGNNRSFIVQWLAPPGHSAPAQRIPNQQLKYSSLSTHPLSFPILCAMAPGTTRDRPLL